MKINWTLVGIAAAAFLLLKGKKGDDLSEEGPSDPTAMLKSDVQMGDLDMSLPRTDEQVAWYGYI